MTLFDIIRNLQAIAAQVVSYINFQGNHNDERRRNRNRLVVSYINFQGNHTRYSHHQWGFGCMGLKLILY